MNLPSKILEEAVEQLSGLPGVGKRSALRYALFLMNEEEVKVRELSESLMRLKTPLHRCRHCHNVSDTEVCPICASEKRQRGLVCVVENVQDVMAVENTQQYRGLYHVLGGVISPIDGISPSDLEIASLVERVRTGLPTTMEGDTTNYYINKLLQPLGVKVTTLARGVAVGDSLEYADEITLGRSIAHRIPFEG